MPLPLKETPQGVLIGDVEFVWARNAKEFFFSNSIVVHTPDALVVDPSANFSFFEHLASQNKVRTVVNSHYHIDHRSLNHLFSNAQFLCHEKDREAILSFDNYLKYADQNQDSSYVMWLKGIFSSLEIDREVIHETLKDKQYLPVKGLKIEVVHLPGHTPGHMGFYFEALKILYVSDIDLTPTGPWYANISSNIDQFIASIARIKAIPADYYISSHGERVYEPEKFLEKLSRFEVAFEKRDQRILESLKEAPKDLETLSKVGIIYKSSQLTDPLRSCFERQMIEKHLERLEKQGKIRQEKSLFML
ncbi:MAG: MBL fold metallo-hydrolase [Deltaproteobacteria bacterium]|nr:MBL fold metallo-hydrolase [Deltaproteobacteria bacterium]